MWRVVVYMLDAGKCEAAVKYLCITDDDMLVAELVGVARGGQGGMWSREAGLGKAGSETELGGHS